MRFTVVIERTPNNYAAYVPDLPGCVATANTLEALLEEIREAIEFHIEGMREDGEPVPEPQSYGAHPHPALRATLSQGERVRLRNRRTQAICSKKLRAG